MLILSLAPLMAPVKSEAVRAAPAVLRKPRRSGETFCIERSPSINCLRRTFFHKKVKRACRLGQGGGQQTDLSVRRAAGAGHNFRRTGSAAPRQGRGAASVA